LFQSKAESVAVEYTYILDITRDYFETLITKLEKEKMKRISQLEGENASLLQRKQLQDSKFLDTLREKEKLEKKVQQIEAKLKQNQKEAAELTALTESLQKNQIELQLANQAKEKQIQELQVTKSIPT
jgi:uncharacterized protein HemY